MIGVKRTALSIHGLGEEDRQWILNNLSDENREKVMEALSYIDGLCEKNNDNQLTRLSIDDIAAIDVNQSDSGMAIQVELTPVNIIAEVLNHEPDNIKRIILNSRHWSWKEEYIQTYGFDKSDNFSIRTGTTDFGVTSRAKESIIENFSNRVVNYNSGDAYYE